MKKLAETIILAAKIREDSYDHESSDEASKDWNLNTNIDFKQFYKISIFEACDKAVKQVGYNSCATQLIYLALTNNWNEILDWANSIVGDDK